MTQTLDLEDVRVIVLRARKEQGRSFDGGAAHEWYIGRIQSLTSRLMERAGRTPDAEQMAAEVCAAAKELSDRYLDRLVPYLEEATKQPLPSDDSVVGRWFRSTGNTTLDPQTTSPDDPRVIDAWLDSILPDDQVVPDLSEGAPE